jgi:hypothetical protein
MFTFEREQSDVAAVEQGGPASGPRRFRSYVFMGVYWIAAGLLFQWFLPTTTLTCRQHASPTASCSVSDRMLLGLVPTGTEQIAGLRGARIVVQPDIRRRPDRIRYRVVLDTAAAGHQMTWSMSLETAYALVSTINERLRTGAPFEASLGFAFWDWSFRAVALLAIAVGATFAALGVSGLRGAPSAAAQDPH